MLFICCIKYKYTSQYTKLLLLGFLLLLPKMRFNVPRPFHIRSHIFSFRCFVVFYYVLLRTVIYKTTEEKRGRWQCCALLKNPTRCTSFLEWFSMYTIPYHQFILVCSQPQSSFPDKKKGNRGRETPSSSLQFSHSSAAVYYTGNQQVGNR